MNLGQRIWAIIATLLGLQSNPPQPDTTPPGVILTATPNTFNAPGTATLIAGVTDNLGAIGRVEFYEGNRLVETVRTAPYQIDVNITADSQTATYRVIVFDIAGNSGEDSKLVTVSISTADTTSPSLTLSVSPNPLIAAGKVKLRANPTDNVGVGHVTFKRSGAVLGTVNSAPWELEDPTAFTTANNGVTTYSAQAFDAAGNPSSVATANATISIPASTLTRSRKRSDYTLPNTPLTVTKAALLAGFFGSPNSEGWYEIADVRCHSLTPGVPCILIKAFDVDLKVKIIRPVLDGLGTPGSNKGGLIVSEGEGSVWVDDYLLFSSPPPVGGNGVKCNTARNIVASSPRELRATRGESYGTGGIYVDRVALSGKFRNIYVGQIGGYNIRGTGYNEDGAVRLTNGRIDTSEYLGYKAQIFQLNNAPECPEGSVIVEYWAAHTDPLAMQGREAGQREDDWNAHASAGAIFRHYVEENGLPWDAAFTGTQAVYGADPASPSGRGYSYSGSGGLGDGYTKEGFSGTPGPNDVTHQVYAEDGTSLNNANVGFGVTCGNRCKGKRLVSYTAGVIRSSAPDGYSKLAVKAAPAPAGESGNNAVQAFQFYMAQGSAALFYGHEMDDLEGSFNWLDGNGNWQQNVSYIADPNGDSGGTYESRLYNSITFRQNGVTLPPNGGGIKVIPKPTTVAGALARLDELRQARIDTFIAAGKVIGMSDRPLGDVTNYWAGVP